ncbi:MULTISPECIES: hypothetical protein [unclassified Campylobacter]|uniref:hypothetical protein n=1 Tax=unclassified Campylobacter TaxID=2593542 RepID=UPI0022E9BD66|nr:MULTISPECIES: hypothetical protein [unclassified Campylobacter]MDA3062066.1 hypothetical protein [Campylobacter sp. JMF_14 EL1]MDA3072830.1 hypothetical protein [Campylobacter sp. JMF_10 EL2]
MKKEKVFSRALSAMLILFGVSVGAFADDDAYADYDDTHHIKIVPAFERANEIPNSGEIPSDSRGAHLGDITYGGTATGTNLWGGLAPTNPNGSQNKWYDENGKKQLVNFSDVDFINIYDQSSALKERFGGSGTYVYGDMVTAGKPIINPMPLNGTGTLGETDGNWKAGYITDGGISGTKNSAADTVKLPKGVTKDDIVFARLYWYGHLYNNNEKLNDSYGPENCDADDVAEAKKRGVNCKRLPKVLKIDEIKGYQDVKVKIAGSTYDVSREICNGYFAYNSSRGGLDGNNQRYAMMYNCSADITDKIKANFTDYDETINVAVGNINASSANPRIQNSSTSNQVYRPANAAMAGNLDGGWLNVPAKLLPFGGWQLVVVYDKSMRSQQKLLADPSKVGASNRDDAKKYLDTYFKPKNITLYDGLTSLEPDTSGNKNITASYALTGFFTPKSGDIKGKLIMGALGANGGLSPNQGEGIFIAENMENVTRLDTNTYNSPNFFNGSKTWLTVNSDGKYVLNGASGYHQGFDLDEFDISDRLRKEQNKMAVRIVAAPNPGGTTNRSMVSFMGVSIDMYVPKLCYVQRFYDTSGWMGFYDLATGEKKTTPDSNIPTVQRVVAGETLYYRTEIRNYDANGEDAYDLEVQLNKGAYNTYQPNSSGVDKNIRESEKINEVEYVYIADNLPGAYSTQKDRANNTNPIASYNGKTLMKLVNNTPRFYLGSNAGSSGSDNPNGGGRLNIGESAYIEFNATVGNTYLYNPMSYRATYKMRLANSTELITLPEAELSMCEGEKPQDVEIAFLNGLKIVNQNFEDLKDTDKTNKQDDRLYTQVAELPFKVNMVFRPDINDLFPCPTENLDDKTGDCSDWNKKNSRVDLCDAFSNIFHRVGEHCVPINTKELPNGRMGIDYPNADGSLKKFDLEGPIFLSAIRASDKGSCYYIDNKTKLPFKFNGVRGVDHNTKFQEKQTDEKLIVPIDEVEIEDAFKGVTFMFSYYPRGLENFVATRPINLENLALDINGTVLYDYNATSGEFVAIENVTQYYIRLQTERLYEKYINKKMDLPQSVTNLLERYGVSRYKIELEVSKKHELEVAWLNDTSGNDEFKDEREAFNADLAKILSEIETAQSYFGTEMSADGSFHICDSDNFVVRPAYFEADMGATDKYAKLVNPAANGDITEKLDERNSNDLRVGGDYKSNIDVLSKVFYAKSYKGNSVPNYYGILGGDLSKLRFSQRDSYTNASLDVDKDTAYLAYRETATYLKPFISGACRENISGQSYYIEKELADQDGLKSTVGTCANVPVPYAGLVYKYGEGKYELDSNAISKLSKGNKDAEFGKVTKIENCLINGKDFDAKYDRVWDKDAISMIADFSVKNINVTDGAAKLKRYNANELRAQGLLEANKKDKRPAALYTSTLYADKNKDNPKGEIFNYYNVGDVMVNIYDNSWTDDYADQTFDSREQPAPKSQDMQDKYWGTKCVINSTSNVHDDRGRIGCDVGIKQASDKDAEKALGLVLRYQPKKIGISMTSLDNGTYGLSWVTGTGTVAGYDANATLVTSFDNNVTVTGASVAAFTYFNSVDIENNLFIDVLGDGTNYVNPANNKAVTNQLDQLAMLKFNAVAYLDDSVYKDIVATLYDGRMATNSNGTSQQVCGFASDMDVDVTFGYDCASATGANDGRCATGVVASNITTQRDYQPYPDLKTMSFQIPRGTSFLTTGECVASANYDSRCYKYNVKEMTAGGVREEMTSGVDQWQLPIPLNQAISYYTDASLNSGFIHRLDTDSQMNPKIANFALMARGFKEGKTPNATIYFNFDRMQKNPSLPVLIYASDFGFSRVALDGGNGKIQPAKFDKDLKIIPYTASEISNSKVEMGSGVELFNENFDQYITRIAKGADKATVINNINSLNDAAYSDGTPYTNFADNIGTYAYFVYGKSYDVSDGENVYEGVTGAPISIDINEYLYCGKTNLNDCFAMPAPRTGLEYLVPAANVFGILNPNVLINTNKSNGWVINTRATGANIANRFVSRYKSTNAGVPVATAADPNDGVGFANGVQTITINSGNRAASTIRILTNPWLIHTPAHDRTRVYEEDAVGRNDYASSYAASGVPQYYNPIEVRFNPAGSWMGEGTIKGKADDVGNFVGESDASASTGGTNESAGRTYRNRRISW